MKRKLSYDIKFSLAVNGMYMDSSIMNGGHGGSKYGHIIISVLKMLRDVGDEADIEVDDERQFIEDFKRYLEFKKVQDVNYSNFFIYVTEPKNVEGRIHLSKPTLKMKVQLRKPLIFKK